MARIWMFLLYILGALFLIFGFVVTGFWRIVYMKIIASELILAPNSQSMQVWSSTDLPIYFRGYLFNWTNPVTSLAQTEIPNFEEKGPYTFKFRTNKSNITWNANNTVSFNETRDWEFVPELSNGSMSDIITTLNVIAVAVGNMGKNLPFAEKIAFNGILSFDEKRLYVRKSAQELLFEGYDDPILDLADKLKKFVPSLSTMPKRFGWWYGKNVSEVYQYNINTGADNINKLALVNEWNYKSKFGSFRGRCDQVRGSRGDLWPMNNADLDLASIFIPDLCSVLDLSNSGENYIQDLEGVEFVGTESVFDNGTINPNNECYCHAKDACGLPSGVRNATACLGAPAFISFPHFYLADESYRSAIQGMNPDPEKHKFHLTLQKDSGLMLDVAARLQINVLLEPVPGISLLSNVPRLFIPGIWFEETAEIPDNLMDEMKFNFHKIPLLITSAGLISVIAGAVFLVIAFVLQRLRFSTTIEYTERLD